MAAAKRGAPTRRGGSGVRGTLRLRKIADRSKIVGKDGRKRETGDGEAPDFDDGERWNVSHVRLLGRPPESLDVSESFVAQGTMEGWLSLARGQIWFELEAEGGKGKTLKYEILDMPGRKDDPEEPAGYRVDHFFTLGLAK